MEVSSHGVSCATEKPVGQDPDDTLRLPASEDARPSAHWAPSTRIPPTTMSVSLEAGVSPVEPSAGPPALANTLITALGETLSQRTQVHNAWIPDPLKL